MGRNKGLDVVRAVAILSVVIYHLSVLQGGDKYIQYPIVHTLISLGGEIGVTLFFIISGYGIFLSIDRQKQKNNFSVAKFFEKRCLRILPQYYLSLLIIIFIGTQGAIISGRGLIDIVTHALLIHNLFPATCSSISTVLWTMGVIFQFYLISIPLYKWIKRNPILTLVISVLFSIICKIIIYHVVFPKVDVEPSYYFIYGRQIFTALDNFVVGMFLAYCKKNLNVSVIKKNAFVIASIVSIIGWCKVALISNPYQDNLTGYVWHSILALLLGFLVWIVSSFKLENNTWYLKIIMFIAKYQYGIYLWHFVVASNLLQNSPIIIRIANKSFALMAIVVTIVCVLVGYISTITLEAPDYKKLLKYSR